MLGGSGGANARLARLLAPLGEFPLLRGQQRIDALVRAGQVADTLAAANLFQLVRLAGLHTVTAVPTTRRPGISARTSGSTKP